MNIYSFFFHSNSIALKKLKNPKLTHLLSVLPQHSPFRCVAAPYLGTGARGGGTGGAAGAYGAVPGPCGSAPSGTAAVQEAPAP